MTSITDLTNPFLYKRLSRKDVQDQLDGLFRLDGGSATELILVRHAEPAASDCANPLLSCCGLSQAERLAERLSPIWVEAIYASPERRAQQTAHILAEACGSEVGTIQDLREIGYEPCTGFPGDGEVTQRFIETPRWDSIPGFGPSRDFRRRALQALEAVVAKHPGQRVVVVTHASIINAYLSAVLSIPRDVFFAPDHTSISCLNSQGELYALRSLNDTAHLAGHIGRSR